MTDEITHLHWAVQAISLGLDKKPTKMTVARMIATSEDAAIEASKQMVKNRTVYAVAEVVECHNPNCTKEFQQKAYNSWKKRHQEPWEADAP